MANLDSDSVLDSLGVGGDESELTQKKLETIRKRFDICVEATGQNRQEMLDDIRFARLGDQWSEASKYDRARPGKERPMLVVNRLLQFRDRVVNEIRQNTPSIRIRPVADGSDQETAEVLMGIIRHIQDNSNASIAYDTAVEWQVDTGLGYIRVRNDWADDKSFDQEIFIDRIVDPMKVYLDPHSKQPDGSDAEWCIIAEEIPKEDFKRLYPDVPETNWEAAGNGDMQGWYTKDSVRLAEYYYIEHSEEEIYDEETGRSRMADVRKCMWCKVTGQTVLEEAEIPTKYIPIVPVLGHEVWVQGRRYLSGLVRNAKDAQRLYNYYLSANAENVALAPKAPFIGVAGQFETDPRWGRANQESLAYLEYDPVSIAGTPVGPPQRAQPPQASSAIMQAVQLAENDIMQSMGIYQPSLGGESNETSGRALMLRQKQTETGNFHYQDNLNRSIRQCGRIILDMVPKIYDRARVIRILGEDGVPQQVNVDPNMPQASAYTDNPAIDSIYNPTIGTYDVVCDSGPSYATKRDEAANMMLALTQANPSLFNMIGDLMLKNMDWPGAEEISKRLQAMLPPNLQPTADGTKVDPQVIQAQQMMEQMATQMEHMSAEMQGLQNEAMLKIQEAERQWFDSQTKRIDVEGKLMVTDQQLQAMVNENLKLMLGMGMEELPEENMEFESLEETAAPGIHNGAPQVNPKMDTGSQPAQPKAPRQPKQSKPGAMARKPNIAALTGEQKPEQQDEM
jgi:Phage P22-like portal protein